MPRPRHDARHHLVDGRSYDVRLTGDGGDVRAIVFARDTLTFQTRGIRITIDDIVAIREIPFTNGGRAPTTWHPIAVWYLQPKIDGQWSHPYTAPRTPPEHRYAKLATRTVALVQSAPGHASEWYAAQLGYARQSVRRALQHLAASGHVRATRVARPVGGVMALWHPAAPSSTESAGP